MTKGFEARQQARKAKRTRQQRLNAKLMRKMGGYNSSAWSMRNDSVSRKVRTQIVEAAARKEYLAKYGRDQLAQQAGK